MIERVEAAIERAGMAWKEANGGDDVSWADIPTDIFSRAAIEAMREPTEAMMAIASSSTVHMAERWRAMIDKALADG